mmetsp:Transcript_96325/g.171169  ORF Transcript_96325/g.171169 Transcript_96325/m.171169 type:complete len:589 (-) Transcript_96325:102-1868(-)
MAGEEPEKQEEKKEEAGGEGYGGKETGKKKLKTAQDIFGASSEEEEDEEDDEEEKEEEAPPPPPGAPMGKTPVFDPEDEQLQQEMGKEFKAEGIWMYETGIRGNEVSIVVVPDIWGWRGGRTRMLADFLARSLNAQAIVPRMMDKPPYNNGPQDDGLPADHPIREKGLPGIKGYLMKNTFNFYMTKMTTAVNFCRQRGGAKRIALVGLGWGSWIACYCAEHLGKEFGCGVFFYPVLHVLAQWDDVLPEKLIRKCKAPLLFMPSGDEPADYHPEGEWYEENHAKFDRETECELFPNMECGWAMRGDLSDPLVRQETIRAFSLTVKFMRKFMWPFPLGGGYGYLRLMAGKGDTEAMKVLLDQGVPPCGKDSQDEVKQTPIFYAAREGFGGACKLLVEYEADVNEIGGVGEETALHVASQNNKFKAITFLLALKADPQTYDKGGQRALHRAARVGAAHSIKALLTGRVEVDTLDTCGQTPVHIACFFGNEDTVSMLLNARADVEAETIRGQTPRKVAARQGFEPIVQLIDKDIEKRAMEEFYAEAERQAAAKAAAQKAGEDAANQTALLRDAMQKNKDKAKGDKEKREESK